LVVAAYVTVIVHDPADVPVITPTDVTVHVPVADHVPAPSPLVDELAVPLLPTLKLLVFGIESETVRVFFVITIFAET
jgi:hypothetical protein